MSMILLIVLISVAVLISFFVGMEVTGSFFGGLWIVSIMPIVIFELSWWWVLVGFILSMVLSAKFEME